MEDIFLLMMMAPVIIWSCIAIVLGTYAAINWIIDKFK